MNVVVTGGGTIAPIDDVRHIANTSTGRFSAMISEACLERGATVWHVHAPSSQLPYDRLAHFDLDSAEPLAELERLQALRERWVRVRDRLHRVECREGTASDYRLKLRAVLREQPIDVAFLAMAVSDFEPVVFEGKIESKAGNLRLDCRPTPKVIREVKDWAPGVFLVGFKLLSGVSEAELIAEAQRACQVNRADLTVANDLRLLQAGRHTIHLVRPGDAVETIGPGEPLADRLVDRVFALVHREPRA